MKVLYLHSLQTTCRLHPMMGAYLAATLAAAPLALSSSAFAQQVFQTPEAAMRALIAAAHRPDGTAITQLFGPGAGEVLKSGNPQEDKRQLDAFVAASDQGAKLIDLNETMRAVAVGTNEWTFPIPIVKTQKGWHYDLAAGRDEIANRTIGLNESQAIAACKAIVQAQNDYFKEDRNRDNVVEYAQRLVSTPGTHDGLFWHAVTALERSPLDESIAKAASELGTVESVEPYYGYVFKVLTSQGANASGGAYSYVDSGHMTKGFAIAAHPVAWGRDGVMSFLCGADGKVYEKNIGRMTFQTMRMLSVFNPDNSWKEVAD